MTVGWSCFWTMVTLPPGRNLARILPSDADAEAAGLIEIALAFEELPIIRRDVVSAENALTELKSERSWMTLEKISSHQE